MSHNNSTIYEDLDSWAQSAGTTKDAVIKKAIDHFYVNAIKNPRLARFFAGADLENLKKHQIVFMQKLFSGEEAGGYTSEQLFKIHEDLILNRGLKTIHFDYFVEDFLFALRSQGLDSSLISKIQKSLVLFREVFDQATTNFTINREERLFFALDDDADGLLPEEDFRKALKSVGLDQEDPRLEKLYQQLDINRNQFFSLSQFSEIVSASGLLIERALQGALAIPDFEDFSTNLDSIFEAVLENTSGQQAQYIPPLAEAEPEKFGVGIVTIDGQVYLKGDHDIDFSIQSMCKPFNYCYALEELGEDEVHQHVGNEPSGRAFNNRDLMSRLSDNKADAESSKVEIPYNPMINAGAIMTASLVKSHEPFEVRFNHVKRLWSKMIGADSQNPQKRVLPRFNKEMARQENYTGYNNLALGYLLMATGKLPTEKHEIPLDSLIDDPNDYEFIFEPSVANALKLYFSTCSLELNAKEMATAAATLANGGVCPTTQERVLSQSTVRSCLSVTQMCGMYDGSGDFFYSIGLPAKSGVGGGVILVVPKLMGICIFSPRLDAQGNSVRGVDVAKRLVQQYRLHAYDGVMTGGERIDPSLPLSRWKATLSSEALWAASKGDIRTLHRLHQEQYDLELGDYDMRTPMHLAAAEGHSEVIKFLLEHGVKPKPDRWGGYPLSDALENEHTEIVEIFKEKGFTESSPIHLVEDPKGVKDAGVDYGDDLAVIELLWAASENNLTGLKRLIAQGVPVCAQDYDKRTPLHLAACEGHIDIVKYLVTHGHPLHVRDRWLATPLDEAKRQDKKNVVEYLELLT